MKKFLALVLALVMTMSLVTISAGAEDFTDDASITYEEAVDVMTAIGVVGGYADGSFNPTATLTRGAAAKIICNMILGPTEAGALATVEAPFKDVPADHVFAGYIAYCASEGIISGYTDGTFRPAATLTGYAFWKMLLGALGYDASIENYTGANYSINVAKRGLNIGLADGLTGSFVGGKALTREEACLYAFNALNTCMVKYNNKSSISIGDVVINQNSEAEKIYDRVVEGVKLADAAADSEHLFREEYFSKLIKTGTGNNTDNYGRPTNVWSYDGKKIGSYDSKTPVLVLTETTKEQDIFTALGADGISGGSKYVVMDKIYDDGVLVAKAKAHTNGTDYVEDPTYTSSYNDSVVIAKGDKSNTVGTGNGVTVEIYKTDVANHYEMIVIHEYLQKVSSVTKATAGGNARKINMSMGSFETEEFAKGDWVLITKSASSVKTVESAEILENVAVTAYSADTVTAGDETYKYSQLFSGSKTYDMDADATYTLYLDSCGNVIKNDVYTAGVTNAVFVVDVDTAGKNLNDFTTTDKYSSVKYVDAAGKVTVAKGVWLDTDRDGAYDDAAPATKNAWYTVKEDTDNDGYVKFTAVAAYSAADSGVVGYKNSSGDFTLKGTVANLGGVVVNANTTFVLRTKASTYKVVNGVSAMANYGTLTSKTAYALVKDGYATTVYIDVQGLTGSSDADELVYIFKTDAKAVKYDAANKVYYKEIAAIVDGVPTTINVADSTTIYAGLVKIDAYDSNNYVSTMSVVSGTKYVANAAVADNTVIDFEGNVLTVGGTAYVVASDAVVYMIDADDVVTEADASALAGDVNGVSKLYIVYKSTTDSTVTAIYFDGDID